MSGPNQPLVFPVMWSRDGVNNFLRTPEQMRATVEAAGFQVRKWDDVTDKKTSDASRPSYSIQKLVMGEELLAEITRASKRNDEEKRLVMYHAVFERI